MEIKDWITLALGATGTVLGLVNLFRDIRKNQPRLTVTPYPSFLKQYNGISTQLVTTSERAFTEGLKSGEFPSGVTVEVVNIGLAPTHIVGCGLTFQSPHKNGKFYFTIGNEESKKFPMKLEPSAQYGIGFELSPELLKYIAQGMDCAFVELAGGRVFKGASPVFHAYRSYLGSKSERSAA